MTVILRYAADIHVFGTCSLLNTHRKEPRYLFMAFVHNSPVRKQVLKSEPLGFALIKREEFSLDFISILVKPSSKTNLFYSVYSHNLNDTYWDSTKPSKNSQVNVPSGVLHVCDSLHPSQMPLTQARTGKLLNNMLEYIASVQEKC